MSVPNTMSSDSVTNDSEYACDILITPNKRLLSSFYAYPEDLHTYRYISSPCHSTMSFDRKFQLPEAVQGSLRFTLPIS
ncbi:hypothetical protein LENED_008192 [Lentinula edodes]|uniref:Uncharacterized protein n=1 Tax=Lentinula edodes TaxID=5353 RepID=A0A1Q3EGH9_LENED|nr:hypothetical protein LENED_008192 [Lentinula edodes]